MGFPTDWSPRRRPELNDSVARTLFVTAWADREESEGRTYAGKELFDVAPPTSTEAYHAAAELIRHTEIKNKRLIDTLYKRALEAAKVEDSVDTMEEFGFLLAMQALGHGVGLEDEFPGHDVQVPSFEFILD